MKKNVLYIDPYSSDGHINFNKIYTKKLLELNANLLFAFKKDYFKKLGIISNVYDIPDEFFIQKKGSFGNRFLQIKMLRFLDKKLNFNSYDIVILAAYDEISLYFSFISTKLILINHNNLSGLDNKVKRFFYRKISKKNIQLVFEDYMKTYLIEMGITKVVKVNHGLPQPIFKKDIDYNSCLKDLEFNTSSFNHIIFIPSSSSSDSIFFNELLKNKIFNTFIKENKILFVIKGNYNIEKNENILVIKKFLSKEEYNALFVKSDLIVIKYSESFKYRTSAVFLESVANDKLMLLSEIDAFTQLNDRVNYNPYFKTIEEFIYKAKNNLENPLLKPYVNKEIFSVDLNKILKT